MARRILVVEDEAPIREMVCFVLDKMAFSRSKRKIMTVL